jgi:hypothetical protein
MARRKHHRRRHSRRRISGVSAKGALMKVAGIGAGIFAGRMLTTKLGATLNPKISGAIAIVAGIMLPKYLKSDLGSGVGDGLIAAGVLAELQSFNVLSGIGALPMTPPVGQYAAITTGNQYNSQTAKAVGADGRPIMRQAVGYLNGLPQRELNIIGALIEE